MVLSDVNLLTCIFIFMDSEDLVRTVPLVSKAFAAACSGPGPCWQKFELDGLRTPPSQLSSKMARAFWDGLAGWLTRRAACMRDLQLHNLRHLLSPLDATERRHALAAVWGALAAHRRLLSVSLTRSTVLLGPGTIASLATLPALRQVSIHTSGPLDFAELDTLAGSLTQLEELCVCLLRHRGHHCAFRGEFPAKLAALTSLRSLQLEAPNSRIAAEVRCLPEGIAAWGAQLEHLSLVNLGLDRLPPAIGALGALRTLRLARNSLGRHFDGLPLEMTQLLSLRVLELQYNGFDAGPPPLLGELAGLEELSLGGNLWGEAVPELPPTYTRLRRLQRLSLTNCELRALPPTVAALPQLRTLLLNINQLETLPPGPYLRHLECLDLSHNRFAAGYPRVLAAAAQLRCIAFQHGGIHYCDPEAALRDAAAPPGPGDDAPAAPVAAPAANAAALLPPWAAGALLDFGDVQ